MTDIFLKRFVAWVVISFYGSSQRAMISAEPLKAFERVSAFLFSFIYSLGEGSAGGRISLIITYIQMDAATVDYPSHLCANP